MSIATLKPVGECVVLATSRGRMFVMKINQDMIELSEPLEFSQVTAE